jgi:tetratricopeptide (TPR) repeat protein/tRNA A-37 threonylcarbamoyl transferase component Bud32
VVAIKLLLNGALASESTRRRFEREIDLVATLQHPNIVRLYDSGTTAEGHPYFVMEYIEGTTLDDAIRTVAARPSESPSRTRDSVSVSSLRATLSLFAKICDAVNYAHQRGVMHRDLKPSNIRLDPAGEPHVLDFGLAKSSLPTAVHTDQPTLSVSCQFMGSLPWASPEQAEGLTDRIDLRTDIYSLGVLLYQLLTGRFPYPVVGALPTVIENVRSAAPARPSSMRAGIDDELETIVLKTLDKEPARRYQTAGELAREIERYLRGEPIEAKRDSAWYIVRKTMRRYRLAAGVATGFLMLAVLVAITTSVLYKRALRAEQIAEQRRAQAEVEVEKVRRTKQFLQGMFGSLDPTQSVGRDAGLLRQILDDSASRVEAELAAQPEVEAPVRATIGATYASLGDYAAAEANLTAALKLYRTLPQPDEPEMLQALTDLAEVYQEQGRFAEAEPLAREALTGSGRVLGKEHRSTLTAANTMALLLHSMGNLGDAEQLFRETLVLQRRTLGEDHAETISSKGNLGQLLLDRGDYEEAAPLVQEALEARRRLSGPDHPDTVTSINNAARLAQEQGRFDQAEALYKEASDGYRRILGDDHPRTLKASSNLAVLYRQQGRLAEAEALLRDALVLQRRRIGDDDPAAAPLINNLARVLQGLGKPAEAEPLLRSVRESLRQAYGEEHPQTLTAMNNLAGVLIDLDRRDEATELFRRCTETRRRTLGADHPQTLLASINWAAGLRDCRRLDEALAIFETTTQAAASLPSEHWLWPYLRGGHGETLVLLERFAEAEPLLLDSYRVFRATRGDAHPASRNAAARLSQLYRAWEKPDKAAAYEPQAAE